MPAEEGIMAHISKQYLQPPGWKWFKSSAVYTAPTAVAGNFIRVTVSMQPIIKLDFQTKISFGLFVQCLADKLCYP